MPHNDPLLEDLRRVLASPSPALLIEASSALAALNPEAAVGPDGLHVHAKQDLATVITQLAPTLVSNDDFETNAVLRVWAEMLGDDMLRRRVKHSVSTRYHPDWLDSLPEARVTRVLGMGDPFGEEETVMLEIHIGQHTFTLACAVIYLGGPLIEDGYLLPVSIAAACGDVPTDVVNTIALREIPLPEARQLLEEALDLSNITYPPYETDSWPLTQPALEWFLRIMPQAPGPALTPVGGTQALEDEHEDEYAQREAEVTRSAQAFQHSLEGLRLPPKMRDEAPLVFELQQNYGTGDLLRWGPRFVEALMMDLYPRKYLAPDQILLQLPRLLSAIVTWAHGQSGVAEAETQKVLRIIKRLTPEYRTIVKAGAPGSLGSLVGDTAAGGFPGFEHFTPVGPALGSRGAGPGSGFGFDPGFGLDELPDDDFIESFINANPDVLAQFMRFRLEEEAGSAEELDALDTQPIIDFSFDNVLDSYEVPDDLHPRLRTIASIIADVGGAFFADRELITVAYMVIACSAARDPAIYRRRASDEGGAAAACWVAAQNNRWFRPYYDSARSVKALTEAFGLRSSPDQRGRTMLRGMEVEEPLRAQDLNIGDSTFLTSTRRAEIIAERDALGNVEF